MCDSCGCHLTTPIAQARESSAPHVAVDVLHALMSENDRQAAHNRAHLDHHGIFAVNLMSSPGAGKTALLEATLDALACELRIAVIEGDLETENDALRIRRHGVPAVQITTGSACHLDAAMVHEALHRLDLDQLDLLFIENVGNLVCPASFDLGQHRNVVLLAVTEGDDKPSKYPVMFRAADLVLLSKADLLPLLEDFNADAATRAVRELGRDIPVISTAASRRCQSLESWLKWLRTTRQAHTSRPLRPCVEPLPLAPLTG